ncbi:helix-turn-helix domain-containing protein [Caballeronia sp. LjRoot34]|uniref:GlxA family transcriptional regulator n=1 Tax=Caballeronia sp. LjRoot34 TaxID=3342325 RepID=UPI003ECCC513
MNLEGARCWANSRQAVSIEQGTRRHGHATKKRIAILVYENCSFVEIGLIVETFDLANSAALTRSGQTPHYSVSLLSSKGGRIQCSNSISMETSPLEGASPSGYDALFIAGGEGAAIAASDGRTREWLRGVFQTVRVVQAAGNGTLLLKGANLPNARGTIIPIRPAGKLHSPALGNDLVIDVNAGSPIITALSLIKSDFDYETAEGIAERLMPFSGRWLEPLLGDLPNANVASTIKEASRWIEEHCARPITVADMAQSVSMGERTFLRHFKAETGMPPSEYLLRTRLDIACRLLITTTLPIDKVARRCGMRSGTRLAKIFKRRLGISATDYRNCARKDFGCS